MEENLEPQETADFNRIVPVNIEEQMKTAYIDYSMSVIVGRAMPDVRDGLKPVHRRILHAMNELGMSYNRPYKKSARIVGEVLGKYHPHGDTAVYDAMVRMAQEWSIRYLLIDGQGNFGSQDGDGPAAMRYTEARLHRISESMLMDIEKDTVDFGLTWRRSPSNFFGCLPRAREGADPRRSRRRSRSSASACATPGSRRACRRPSSGRPTSRART